MKKITLLVVVILIIFGAAYFFFNSTQKEETPLVDIPATSPLPTSFSINTNDLKQGGASYGDPNGIFSFLYPLDYKQDLQNDGKQVRISKIGDTQTGQTEIYDGVVIVFEGVTLGGQSLNTWVEESIKNASVDGTIEVIEPKKAVKVNNYPGFRYKLRGLGEFDNLVLQKDTKSDYAVVITTMVADPQSVGFQEDVDRILATLEIFK